MTWRSFSATELATLFERDGLPYAPIMRPEQLFDDPHLQATGGLAEVRLTDGPGAGGTAQAALLPLTLGGDRLGVRLQPPLQGEHTEALLAGLGYPPEKISALQASGAVR